MIRASDFHKLLLENQTAIEAHVDTAIRRAAERGERVIRVAVASSWRRDDIEAVLLRYTFNGWKVEHVTDPRDGDFLELTPKREW